MIGDRLTAEVELKRQTVVSLVFQKGKSLLDAQDDTPVLNLLDPPNLPIEKSFRPAQSS